MLHQRLPVTRNGGAKQQTSCAPCLPDLAPVSRYAIRTELALRLTVAQNDGSLG
jgi:hypothetical protein